MDYQDFVFTLTSKPSKNVNVLAHRLNELNQTFNAAMLATTGLGLASEAGEYAEIVKKMLFQGKEPTKDNIFHMKRELGDILFYFTLACILLDTSISEIEEMNREKLEARYNELVFSVFQSENRKIGDL
jgi:NTP pyrophosphatase (non-canonical NTP hydrolase)